MAKVLVYNPGTNRMEVYYRSLSQRMPYAQHMTVKEFRSNSASDVIWTDKRAMQAWNDLRSRFAKPIDIGFAFKKMSEGGHTGQSQHYAGVAFDLGQKMTSSQRDRLRNLAIASGKWGYVEPKALTPTWVGVNFGALLISIVYYFINLFINSLYLSCIVRQVSFK